MIMISRMLIGLGAALLLVVGLGLWFAVEHSMLPMGLSVTADRGLGTVRADIAGLFVASGALGVAAALSLNRNLLWPLQLLLVVALIGRIITFSIDGLSAAGPESMVIEVLLLVVLQWCRNLWPNTPV